MVEATTTIPLAAYRIKQLSQIAENCGAAASAQTSDIGGFGAVRMLAGDPATFHREEWRAPALGCLTVRKTVYHRTPDGRDLITNQIELVDARLGDPDPALFATAPSYKELTPTQVVQLIFKPYPNVPVPDEKEADAAYQAGQATLPQR